MSPGAEAGRASSTEGSRANRQSIGGLQKSPGCVDWSGIPHEARDMQAGRPSRTALGAAGHRAAHQVLERGFIVNDPLAVPILGYDTNAIIEHARSDASTRPLRLFIAARSRYAEDSLRSAETPSQTGF
jgi:hypothetical protein